MSSNSRMRGVALSATGVALAWALIVSVCVAVVLAVWSAHSRAPVPIDASPGRHPFAIKAQPLSEALTHFSEQAGLQLVYRADVVTGLRSGAVEGSYSDTDALDLLLEPTGLSYRVTGRKTVTIEKSN